MSELTTSANALAPIMDLLACPHCRGPLAGGGEFLACGGCGRSFPLHEGIPLLGSVGDATGGEPAKVAESSVPYQKLFLDGTGAQRYRDRYEKRFYKRFTTRRELGTLRRLLATQPRSRVLLDLPSGNGRVSEPLSEYTDLLLEADIGLGQVALGRKISRVKTPQFWMTASVFNIPLRDGSVDGAVCNRLLHHLPTRSERERAMGELLRVTRRFVLLTFFDYYSLKNLSRLARRWFSTKTHKNAVSAGDIADLARPQGATLVACPRLFLFGSGQRYALLVKPSPA
jgi:hypothetical protein